MNNNFKEFTTIIDRLTIILQEDKLISFLMIDTLMHIVTKAFVQNMEMFQQHVNMDSNNNDRFNELMVDVVTQKFRDFLKYEGEKE